MMTRSLASILSVSLSLTACADVSFEADDAPEAEEIEHPHLKLPAGLETTVFTALGASRRDGFVMRQNVDVLGKTHVRVRQLVNNIPVLEGEAIVHVAPDGTTEVTDKRDLDIDVDTTPRVTAERAVELARAACPTCAPVEAPQLWIVREDRARLAWRVELAGVQDGGLAAPIAFVDAHDGSIVKTWDNVQHATGDTLYNGLRTIPSLYHNNRYYLEDREYNLGVYDFNGHIDPDSATASRIWSSDTIFETRDYAQAMFSVRSAAEYFWGTHRHWNPDGVGGPGRMDAVDQSDQRLSVYMNAKFDYYGTIYGSNASWYRNTLLLGQGDDETTDWSSLDITGHEFTHGVIQYTAGLIYMNESGAINESWADVFGAMTERYRLGENANTWRIGENVYSDGSELRRMDEPTSDGVSADHYAERVITTSDRGGVHYNSGIGNKAFHLVANGGTHRKGGSMRGIGADRAAKIWFLALNYLNEGAKFVDARGATQNAARDLYGYQSVEWNAVANAWAMVGVGIVSNDILINGTFESDGGWELTGRAFTTTGTPHSGSRYLLLGGLASQPGSASQVFSIDPFAKTATLSFYVNVTTTDTSWLPVDRMVVDVLDADTGASLTRLGTWTNLAATTAGNYVRAAFDLAQFRGRTVRIKLDSANSPAAPTTFRVDTMQMSISR